MLHFPPLGLEVRHLLGSGSFAQVYACFDPKDNKHYALKVLSPSPRPSPKRPWLTPKSAYSPSKPKSSRP